MAAKFSEKVVWITGGGTGIGEALALEFSSQGAVVAVSGRRVEPLEDTVAQVEEIGGRALAVPADVTKVGEIQDAVDEIISEAGRLDVVVANAGYSVAGPFEELTASDWRRQFDVNVVGVATTVKFALPHLRETGGYIALMGSVAGMVGLPSNGPYSASKFAVRSMGQTLTTELAGSGVSCTTLLPGFVESEIGRVDNQGEHHADWEDRRPKNWMWPADRAARSMVRAIGRRRTEAVITGHGKIVAFFGSHAPRVTQRVIGQFGQNARNKKTKK